jgi:hypothetical protein
MLEYFKTILYKVSFSSSLFEKELKKALQFVGADEITSLKDWCYQEFGSIYQSILNKCFAPLSKV